MSEKADILIDGKTGEMWFAEWACGSEDNRLKCERVPADAPIRKAVEVGQKVMEAAKGGKVLPPIIRCESNDGGVTLEPEFAICFPVVPAPSKGLKWLMSLPVGARRMNAAGASCFIVFGKEGSSRGLFFIESGYKWLWDNSRREGAEEWQTSNSWVANAYPETCPMWKAEEAAKEAAQ